MDLILLDVGAYLWHSCAKRNSGDRAGIAGPCGQRASALKKQKINKQTKINKQKIVFTLPSLVECRALMRFPPPIYNIAK